MVGDKWSLLIIRDLAFKQKNTYGDFLIGGEGISTNILADRLALLECNGIIEKRAHPDSKSKILYSLTVKGIDLVPLLVEMILWSEKYYDVHPHAIQFAKQIKKNKPELIKSIMTELKASGGKKA